jgi:sortase A
VNAGRRTLGWLEGLFWTVGCVLVGWCSYVLVSARLYQDRQGRALDALTARPSSSTSAPAAPEERPVLDPLLIGRLEIPRLGLSSLIREGDDEDTLRRAIGHIPGTALFTETKGNVALAAHRDSYFRPLRDIATGDEIRVTTRGGFYKYRVVKTEIVWPKETRVLDSNGTPELTLVTCWPFNYVGNAPRRFVVTARRLGYGAPSKSSMTAAHPRPPGKGATRARGRRRTRS